MELPLEILLIPLWHHPSRRPFSRNHMWRHWCLHHAPRICIEQSESTDCSKGNWVTTEFSWVDSDRSSDHSARSDSTQPVELRWVESDRALWSGLISPIYTGDKVDRDKLLNSRCCRFVAEATVDFQQSQPCWIQLYRQCVVCCKFSSLSSKVVQQHTEGVVGSIKPGTQWHWRQSWRSIKSTHVALAPHTQATKSTATSYWIHVVAGFGNSRLSTKSTALHSTLLPVCTGLNRHTTAEANS